MNFKAAFYAELMVHLDFHNQEMGGPTMDAFFAEFEHEDRALVMEAMRRLRRAQWMPKPYDVQAELDMMRVERHRALREAAALKALPVAEPTEAERQNVLQQLRAFTAKLIRGMRTAPAEPRTVAESAAEVARLRVVDRTDPAKQAAVEAQKQRMRDAGLL